MRERARKESSCCRAEAPSAAAWTTSGGTAPASHTMWCSTPAGSHRSSVHSTCNLYKNEKKSNENISCNEVYYTACSLLVILKNSCSKVHCQKGFNLIFYSYEIRRKRRWEQTSSSRSMSYPPCASHKSASASHSSCPTGNTQTLMFYYEKKLEIFYFFCQDFRVWVCGFESRTLLLMKQSKAAEYHPARRPAPPALHARAPL